MYTSTIHLPALSAGGLCFVEGVSMTRKALVLLMMAAVIAFVAWVVDATFTPAQLVFVAVLGMLATVPLAFVARRRMDREPSIERARDVVTWFHFAFGALVASALVAATRYTLTTGVLHLPVPPWMGMVIMVVSSAVVLLVMANLALKGRGAPFAVALTRLVAVEWFYAWTRNPMVLAGTVGLVGLGLYLGSGLFLLYIVLLVIPAFIIFLTLVEERELEIRFGQPYLDYKARTPPFFPRRPR